MADTVPCTFSDVHARAICDEVGERLRLVLDRSQTPTPPRILALLLQLQLSEMKAPEQEQSRRTSTAA